MLTQLLTAIVCFLSVYLTGYAISGFVRLPKTIFYRSFFTLTLGILCVTFIYALILTGGKTILLLLLLPGVYSIYTYRPFHERPLYNLSEFFFGLFLACSVFIPVLLYHAWFYYDFFQGYYKYLFIDSYYFGDFSNGLRLWASESKFSEINTYFPENRKFLVPYHYPELWLTGFFSSLTKQPGVFSYILITIPLLTATFGTGIMSLFENGSNKKRYIYLLGFFCLFVSGVYLPLYNSLGLHEYTHWSESSILGRAVPKYGFVFIFLLHACIYLLKNEKQKALLTLLSVPVLSLTFLPATAGGFFVLLAAVLWKDGKTEFFKLYGILLCAILLLFFYAAFYFVYGSNYASDFAMQTSFTGKLLHGNLALIDIKILMGNLLFRSGIVLLFFTPFLPFVVFLYRKYQRFMVFSIVFVFSGMLASCLMYPVMDSSQFGSATLMIFSLLAVLGFREFLLYCGTSNKTLKIIGVLLFVSFSIYGFAFGIASKNPYATSFTTDHEFLLQAANEIQGNPATILLFLNKEDFISSGFPNALVSNDLYRLTQYTRNTIVFSLGNPEDYFLLQMKPLPEDVFYYENACPLRIWKKQHPGKSTADFVKAYHIKYLYVHKGCETPDWLSHLPYRKITSARTGNNLFILE